MTPDLFEPRTKARRTDPATSRIAASMARGLAATHQLAILNFLEGISPKSASYEDISRATGIEKHGIGRRMKEIVTAGRAEIAGTTLLSSGRPGQTWRAR